MITCRTPLTRRTIRALAAFHAKKSPKSILISATGGFLFLLSLINAYGLWMKYYGNASLLFIFSKSAVLILLSLVLLYTGIRGKTQKLYLELKDYFSDNEVRIHRLYYFRYRHNDDSEREPVLLSMGHGGIHGIRQPLFLFYLQRPAQPD